MWLINSQTRRLEHFISDDSIPPYAILSHTWGREEVTLQEWRSRKHSKMAHREGYKKIISCLRQARKDRLAWAWIDTCCIDKTNSAELSEAINSMFRWYKESVICYAYLSDVIYDSHEPLDLEKCKFNASRWFTRGWTLQELIAPSHLEFRSNSWHLLGSKDDLRTILQSITGIESHYLSAADLDLASTAKKMSWAAHRQTSRVEDRAYSLLGIFDVNMPLIYGEGIKAFQRLQAEILRVKPEDHSIFAWGDQVETASNAIPREMISFSTPHTRQPEPLLGLLAASPLEFAGSGNIVPFPWAGRFYGSFYEDHDGASLPSVFGNAVKIELPSPRVGYDLYFYTYIEASITQARPGEKAGLLCATEKHPHAMIYIPLLLWGPGNVGRTRELVIDTSRWIGEDQGLFVSRTKTHFHVVPERRVPQLLAGDIVLRQFRDLRKVSKDYNFQIAPGGATFDMNRIIKPNGCAPGAICSFETKFDSGKNKVAFCNIVFSRFPRPAPGETLILDLHAGIFLDLDGTFHNFFTNDPAYLVGQHTFEAVSDQWELSVAPHLDVYISVKQVGISSESGAYVYVVDILALDPTEPDPLRHAY